METGLERFLKSGYKRFKGKKLAVLCNQASVDKRLNHISQLVTDKKLGLKIVCFFGPQHGIRGEKQDNMIESEDFIEPKTKKPVISLYGDTRTPSEKAMKKVDVLIIDLQDIGTRIYTFMYTMANCMRVAATLGKKVVVLDRPNPIDGVTTEGNVLQKEFASFVGQFPICTRHGMTMGELACLFNEEFGIGCELEVVKLTGWDRKRYLDSYYKHWVPPSPNIPLIDAAITFPGTVHFEGTNISEGRGTTRPLEFIGAPFINPDKLAEKMNAFKFGGVFFRPVYFQPMFQKHSGEICGGVHIHVTDRKKFNGFKTGIWLMAIIAKDYSKHFDWKTPPYEYEFEKMPIDLIAGTSLLRETIDRGKRIETFEDQAEDQLQAFRKIRKKYLLY